jgi:hypothetical protein
MTVIKAIKANSGITQVCPRFSQPSFKRLKGSLSVRRDVASMQKVDGRAKNPVF